MARILAIISEWLLKNGVQKVLMGAGLSVVSYLAVLTAFRAAFDSLINSTSQLPAHLLNVLGLAGVDSALSAFVSVAVFILNLNSGKLALRKK